ncbi:MAG: alkaline phosphatase D family protein [Cyclobacteriaceae bacterium]
MIITKLVSRLFFCLLLIVPQGIFAQSFDSDAVLTRIAFGSCSHQDSDRQMWGEILQTTPDLYIWLGDNIYGDTSDMIVMRAKYAKQKMRPGYQELISRTPVVGTWDDHDFGINNGGKDFNHKSQSQQAAMDFLDIPAGAPERRREGLYSSQTFGPEGKQVQVILLDARYFRDTVHVEEGISQPNQEGTVLGEAQWKWLEGELLDSKADLILIGSGIQVIPEEHRFEKWANFPKERQRLFDLLAYTETDNAILLSGDRHIAEVSRLQPEGMRRPLYEITSSGLTHTWRDARNEQNRHRVGELIIARNFGLMEIDWSGAKPAVQVRIIGEDMEELGLQQIAF